MTKIEVTNDIEKLREFIAALEAIRRSVVNGRRQVSLEITRDGRTSVTTIVQNGLEIGEEAEKKPAKPKKPVEKPAEKPADKE